MILVLLIDLFSWIIMIIIICLFFMNKEKINKYFISFNHTKVRIFFLHIWLFLIITLIINLIVCQKHGQRVNNMLYQNNTCRCAQVWMMSLIRIFNFRLTLILSLLYQMCQIRITIISQLVCQKHVKGLVQGDIIITCRCAKV